MCVNFGANKYGTVTSEVVRQRGQFRGKTIVADFNRL